MDDQRQTGRTYKMLSDAIAAKSEGRAIRIVGFDSMHLTHMRRLADHIKLGALKSNDFILLSRVRTGALHGLRRENIFVDHYVWEKGFHRDLEDLSYHINNLV